jgi:hypothetical protein
MSTRLWNFLGVVPSTRTIFEVAGIPPFSRTSKPELLPLEGFS